MLSKSLFTITILFLLASAPMPLFASETPLLIEGKDSLFQRVLVREATDQYDAPDGAAMASVPPLTPLFVYQVQDSWLQVGRNEQGADLFWLRQADTVAWNQNIVATFEGSENIDRLLFFKDIDPIYDLLELETPGLQAKEYREEALEAEKGMAPSDTIVALGPRRVIDQRDNLYVMPILDFEEEIFDSGAFVNLLKVAVARAHPGSSATADKNMGSQIGHVPPRRNATPEDYRIGVVFVVDTTISMDPYIRATQTALETVYGTIAEDGLSDAVSFGLIGYRDNTQIAPKLGYSSRTFVTLKEGVNPDAFLRGIDQMDEARSSSKHFREDAYAGIEHALTEMNWGDFDGRYIVLVTDAGPRESDDDFSLTGFSGQGLNTLVRERINGAIAVMHLKTPKGRKDHDRAESAYRDLSSFANQAPFYFPIKNGDPAVFRQAAQDLAQVIAQQVSSFRANPDDILEGGGRRIVEDDAVSNGQSEQPSEQQGQFNGLVSAGRTMQLAFLGRVDGEKAPDVFEAYVADRDFDRTGLKPLSIRVLITKSQLSALYDALKIIVEKGEENVIDPDQFFSQVLGAAADMSRSPDKVARRQDPSLAEATAIDEYIEDLPYKSRIMNVTEDDWLDMSFSEQAAIINDLYDKIQRYEQYNRSTDLWVDYLGTGARAETLLYPLPLDDLP